MVVWACTPKHQDSNDSHLSREAPVERVIGIVRRLRREHDVLVTSCAMLEVSCGVLEALLPLLFLEMHRAGHVWEDVVFEDTEGHGCDLIRSIDLLRRMCQGSSEIVEATQRPDSRVGEPIIPCAPSSRGMLAVLSSPSAASYA